MTQPVPRLIEMSFDKAYIEVERLDERTEVDNGSTTVYSGVHPDHGNIHIVIPAIGAGILLLPFVSHVF